MNANELKRHRPQYYRLSAYEEIKIDGESTVALLSADVGHIFIRAGSDCIKLRKGSSVAVCANFAKIVNPFHFTIDIEIACGLDEIQRESTILTPENAMRQFSTYSANRSAAVTGLKWGVGMMLKRGSAICKLADQMTDGGSTFMVFRNVRPDFLALKPAGAFADQAIFRNGYGETDENVISVSGTYADADVTAWCAASGVTAYQIIPVGAYTNIDFFGSHIVNETTAVFLSRWTDSRVNLAMQIRHLGADAEDFN